MKQEIFGVCAPAFDEAPSSWLSRAAATQALTPRDLCKWLGLPPRRDVDSSFCIQQTREIAVRCGLRSDSFDFACRMLRVGSALRMKRAVLWSDQGRPRYRFCPKCLQDQSTPYFPVHWRFDPWRLCFRHQCLMEEECWNCHEPAILPRHMQQAAGGTGVTFMSQCFGCSELLWRIAPIYVNQLPSSMLSPLGAAQLANGCAFVSAVAHGRMTNLLGRRVRIETELPLMERMQLLVGGEQLSPGRFRG